MLYGPCQLQIPKKSIPTLLISEVLNPFYIFQVFSMVLWLWDGYQKYAACIFVISLWGVTQSLYETMSNIKNVRKMAEYECKVFVKRDGRDKEISSNELVPGDVIAIPDHCIMPCDMILLSG